MGPRREPKPWIYRLREAGSRPAIIVANTSVCGVVPLGREPGDAVRIHGGLAWKLSAARTSAAMRREGRGFRDPGRGRLGFFYPWHQLGRLEERTLRGEGDGRGAGLTPTRFPAAGGSRSDVCRPAGRFYFCPRRGPVWWRTARTGAIMKVGHIGSSPFRTPYSIHSFTMRRPALSGSSAKPWAQSSGVRVDAEGGWGGANHMGHRLGEGMRMRLEASGRAVQFVAVMSTGCAQAHLGGDIPAGGPPSERDLVGTALGCLEPPDGVGSVG